MSPFCQPWVSASPISSALSSWVLDTFEIDQQEYLIVLLAEYPSSLATDDQTDDKLIHCIEISRFEVDGHPCAVVKVEQSNNHAEMSDLALLLTQRELQIATLVALGYPNKQIACQLHISEWTVSTHLRRIFMKLGVDSRAAMVYRCAGLIQRLQVQLASPKG